MSKSNPKSQKGDEYSRLMSTLSRSQQAQVHLNMSLLGMTDPSRLHHSLKLKVVEDYIKSLRTPKTVSTPRRPRQINGSNGEATGTDDMPGGKGKGGTIVAMPKGKTTKTTVPQVTNVVKRNPTYMQYQSIPAHSEFGFGIRIVGCQQLANVTTSASTAQLFEVALGATAINTIALSPDRVNGRVALVARPYARYVFRRVTLEYEPIVASTQAGAFAIGYIPDGDADTFQTFTFASVQDVIPSVVSSFRNPSKNLLTMEYKGQQIFYCEAANATTGSIRQTTQGLFQGYPNASSIGAVTQGILRMHYVLDLYAPCSDFGFTMRLQSEEEGRLLVQTLKSFRERRGKSSSSKDDENSDREFLVIQRK